MGLENAAGNTCHINLKKKKCLRESGNLKRRRLRSADVAKMGIISGGLTVLVFILKPVINVASYVAGR